MDIQKKKVLKDKVWTSATKTAAMAALGLTAGLGLGACSKGKPDPITFGDVGTDLTAEMVIKESSDTTKADSAVSVPRVKKKRKVPGAMRGVPGSPDGNDD